MLERVLAGAAALSALFDADADTHEAAVDFLRARPCRLVAPPSSMTGALDALAFSREAQEGFLEWVREGGVSVEPVTVGELLSLAGTQSRSRVGRAAESLELEILAARTGIKTIMAVDRKSGSRPGISAARVSPAYFREKTQ